MAWIVLLPFLQAPPPGDAEIRGGGIVLRTTRRLAGAIDSLRWNGKEFIDSTDHGRQLQSAASFGEDGPGFWAECYNPTEAGSRADGAGPTSTSVLLSLSASGNVLETRTRMAFWLKPGEASEGRPARNRTALSDHVLSKKVSIGFRDLPNVVEHVATFTVPAGERCTLAQFESLTGYMPPDFSRFLVFDPATGATKPLTDGPGEQKFPVVLATESGSHAMGLFSPEPGASYGRWRFVREKVVKWNCVFRVRKPEDVPPGDYAYRHYVPVGTLEDVVAAMKRLHALFPSK
jgi:hypothetical protein